MRHLSGKNMHIPGQALLEGTAMGYRKVSR
jgi:hypothetical protein